MTWKDSNTQTKNLGLRRLGRDFLGDDLPVDLTFNRSTHDLPDYLRLGRFKGRLRLRLARRWRVEPR